VVHDDLPHGFAQQVLLELERLLVESPEEPHEARRQPLHVDGRSRDGGRGPRRLELPVDGGDLLVALLAGNQAIGALLQDAFAPAFEPRHFLGRVPDRSGRHRHHGQDLRQHGEVGEAFSRHLGDERISRLLLHAGCTATGSPCT
jgi:hypothetical protein